MAKLSKKKVQSKTSASKSKKENMDLSNASDDSGHSTGASSSKNADESQPIKSGLLKECQELLDRLIYIK